MASLKRRAALIRITIGLTLAATSSWAASAPQFTAEEKAWIAAHPVVRTLSDSKWRPFAFRESGKVVGIVPSFLTAVSRLSGLHFEYVDGVTWHDAADALRAGTIDIVPDVKWRDALHAHWARNDIILSRPYFVGTIFVVGPEGMNLFVDTAQLTGQRVAIKGGGALEAAIRDSDIPLNLLTFDDERDALAAVATGEATVALGPDMSILPLLRRQFHDELFVAGSFPDNPYALAIATRRDLPILASILDKSLAAISAREVDGITRQWVESADYGKPSLYSILYYRRWQVAGGGACLLALAAIAFFSWRARLVAIRSEREKAIFLAFISHEIRTPMHTILSSVELLQRSKLAPKHARRADAAMAASESLLTLLDDILEYSRLESHNVTLAPEPTLVESWVVQSADMVRWRADEKDLCLTLELASPPNLCVLIDPIRTRQIVLKIKFTSAGSVTLRADYLEGNPNRGGSLTIEVRDTGIGIPPERQRRIFEPYQRVEQSGNRRVSGSGLGLSICRELVELMKGSITVISSPDKGTIFTVILPVRRIAQAPTPGTSGSHGSSVHGEPLLHTREQALVEPDAPQLTRGAPLILVVDDHESVQHAIRNQLDSLACNATFADTGKHALEQFERASFDMVLLDCALPDIDGYTVAQRMRDSERMRMHAHTPIIAISASTDDAHRKRCFESGMDGVLGKPLRLDTLRQMVDLWCPSNSTRAPTPSEGNTPPSNANLREVYRRSVDADLAALGDALSKGDADRAGRAAHRIKGAAAVTGHAETSRLAAELERRLKLASDGIPAGVGTLGDELLHSYRIDTAEPDNTDA